MGGGRESASPRAPDERKGREIKKVTIDECAMSAWSRAGSESQQENKRDCRRGSGEEREAVALGEAQRRGEGGKTKDYIKRKRENR